MKRIIILCFLASVFNVSNSQPTVGVIQNNEGNQDGYVLFAPLPSKTTFLIDKCGNTINTWTSSYTPGFSAYLLEDGSLLRAGYIPNSTFTGAVRGGIIEKYNWEGAKTWSYTLSNSMLYQDHDIYPLPNGNVLAIIITNKSYEAAIEAGRDSTLLGNSMWGTRILELQPIGEDSAEIVWEWRTFDHLIQDFDPTKENYGIVSAHPELININYHASATNPDWLHINSIAYNPELDQIVLSVNHLSEFWIIDHSTSTQEAASHTGGNSGKGGDIIYRFGNPESYGRGNITDLKLFNVHNAHWIESGFAGEGTIILFNNGNGRPEGDYSSIDTYALPYDSATRNYLITDGQPYLPQSAAWTYVAPNPTDFFSIILAGVQRLSNGNTLICEATKGNFFEIDSNNNTVWQYISPLSMNGPVSQGEQAVNNYVYRCSLYEPTYSAFTGRTLIPGLPIELNPLPNQCSINSVESVNQTNSLTIFPNPVIDKLFFRFTDKPTGGTTLNIFDCSGKIVLQKENIFTNEIIISKDELRSSGLYFYSVNSASFSVSGKFILK